MKWIIIVIVLGMLVGCGATASFTIGPGGTVSATNGAVTPVFDPTCKTFQYAFTPSSNNGNGMGEIIQLLQALTGVNQSMALRQGAK